MLTTLRLQLRQPTRADTLILRHLWQNERVREFLGGVVSDKIIDEKLCVLHNHWDNYGFGLNSVFDKAQQRVIGICGLHHSEDGIELSYMFFPASWGKGLAKEAVLASLEYGLATLKLNKIIAITQAANDRSRYLLEAAGMHHIDTFERFAAIQYMYEMTSI